MTKTERDRDLIRRCIVEKWALLVANPSMKEPSCPLCAVYRDEEKYGVTVCFGCPIFEMRSGQVDCHGTPYPHWRQLPIPPMAAIMEGFLWGIYDDLTEKMLAEREGNIEGPCQICGAEKRLVARLNGEQVCHSCLWDCYDADGHYLVPVVRGGPWTYHRGAWEHWVDNVCVATGVLPYTCISGAVNYDGDFGKGLARPGVEFHAPEDYTGDLPAGCRWAEGSEPKPYKVLEGSMDKKTWTEILRSEDLGAVMIHELGIYAQIRTRIIEANGKTRCTDIGMVDLEVLYGTDNPKPRPDTTFRVHDRVLVTRECMNQTGEYGTVTGLETTPESCRMWVTPDNGRFSPSLWEANALELVCRGSDGRDALALVRRLAQAVAGGDIGEAARIAREGEACKSSS